ncbi:MAG: 30S ribosomal protein S20 [Fimbriimonadales bacterium]|nr:30S ribosomal protein S20 [Fimbriimonadales bacterium]
MSQKKIPKKDLRRSKWRSALARNERLRLRNQSAKSALKTFVKKAKGTGDVEAVKSAAKALDKAAERGIIHRNQAARRKSRLMKAANRVATGA